MSFSDRFVSFHGTIKRIKTETYKRVSKHKYKIQTWRHTRHVILELVTIHFIKSKNESKIIFTASIIAMLLLSVGCNKELTGIEFGQEFQLAYNQKATITDAQTGESLKRIRGLFGAQSYSKLKKSFTKKNFFNFVQTLRNLVIQKKSVSIRVLF